MSTILTKFCGFSSRQGAPLAIIVGSLSGGAGLLVWNERDGRDKIATTIGNVEKKLGQKLGDVETKLGQKLDDVETKFTGLNKTTNALIITTASKTVQGLNGDKKPLREWLEKARGSCRDQSGDDCN